MLKMQIIGNLGKDCVTNTVNGKNVINFNVAHTERFRDTQGNQREKTQWVDCAYWTDRTGIAPYLKKGTQIWADGIPEVKTYPKNDGTTGISLTLRVLTVQLCGGRSDAGAAPASQPYQQNNQPAAGQQPGNTSNNYPNPEDITAPIDDLPF